MEKNMRVVVRVRPFSTREMEQNQRNLIRVLDNVSLIFDPEEDIDEFFYQGTKQNYRDITKRVNKKLTMDFDEVFDADSSNQKVFEACIQPLIKSVMDGFNCSVFVYGATGAGKTHTMLGNENCRGITFLTIKELFASINQLSNTRKFDIGISYLEVYNEQVMNLLTKSGPLKLREDAKGVIVSGLNLKKIENAEELYDLLILGNKNRTQHPTDANAESSRSHAIFQVHIRMTDKQTSQKRTVKLSMIDLAGSERAASTKCMGQRFKEGASINKSLLALGNCINKLADGLKHVPYRDSNLTRILKDSLGGNTQTLMIANVSPSSLTYEDTYNTLKYASRAKKIRTTLRQNIVRTNMTKEYYIKQVSEMQLEIDKLKNLVKQSEAKVAAHQISAQQMTVQQAVDSQKPTQNIENNKVSPKTSQLTTTEYRSDVESPELDEYCQNIDASFLILLNAQSACLAILSRIKILKLRSDLKQKAELCSKILSLDGSHLVTDIAKLEASIGKYDKDVSRNEVDFAKWKKRNMSALKEIERIRKEISGSNHSRFLKSYINLKEKEVEIAKFKAKQQHILLINSIYFSEMECNSRTLDLCYKIIQENYLLLRAKGQLDRNLTEQLEKLVKLLQRQRSVKFATDEDEENESDIQNLSLELSESDELLEKNLKRGTIVLSSGNTVLNGACESDEPASKKNNINLFKNDETFLNPNDFPKITSLSKNINLNETHDIPSTSTNFKSIRNTELLDGLEYFPESDEPASKKNKINLFKNDETFLNPNDFPKITSLSKNINLNETHDIPSTSTNFKSIRDTNLLDGLEYLSEINSMNSTFQLSPSGTVAQRAVLTERNSNKPLHTSKKTLNRVITKPVSKTKILLSAVAKENRKFSPNRHNRKSPRALLKKTVISKPKIGLINHQRSTSSSSSNSSNTPAQQKS